MKDGGRGSLSGCQSTSEGGRHVGGEESAALKRRARERDKERGREGDC